MLSPRNSRHTRHLLARMHAAGAVVMLLALAAAGWETVSSLPGLPPPAWPVPLAALLFLAANTWLHGGLALQRFPLRGILLAAVLLGNFLVTVATLAVLMRGPESRSLLFSLDITTAVLLPAAALAFLLAAISLVLGIPSSAADAWSSFPNDQLRSKLAGWVVVLAAFALLAALAMLELQPLPGGPVPV